MQKGWWKNANFVPEGVEGKVHSTKLIEVEPLPTSFGEDEFHLVFQDYQSSWQYCPAILQ